MPLAVLLRLALSLVALVCTQVLPLVVYRPDLRGPLLLALRALAVAAWRQAPLGGRDELSRRRALRTAVLALQDALLAVVEAEDDRAAPHAVPAPSDLPPGRRVDRASRFGRPRAALARDGPPVPA